MTAKLLLLLGCFISLKSYCQNDTIWYKSICNENLTIPSDVEAKKAIYKGKDAILIDNMVKKEEGGICLLNDVQFINGTVEFDLASDTFAGITFRTQNEQLGECIYFRPFNAGTVKHKRTVQYVAKGTKYTWFYLRENFPGVYESAADIKKNEWFHVKLEINGNTVKVYVNNLDEPSLVVNDMKLDVKKGFVGLWTWKAYYSNLKIVRND